MFSSTGEASGRYARAAGRIVFGLVLILGAATFVERLLRMDHPAAAKTLAVIWLAALFAGWLFSQLAAATAQRIDVEDIFTVSWVLPTIGVALLIPLTLHVPIAFLLGGTAASFDGWAKLSLVITGPAHIAFAFLAALRAAQLARGQHAIGSARVYVATIVVASVPFAIILFIPPLLVGLTGFALLPFLHRMRSMIERDRPVSTDLPKAVWLA